jgi:hypothetical protein
MIFRSLTLFVLAFGLFLSPSFAGERGIKNKKKTKSAKEQKLENKEMELLSKSTEIYWKAMRWQSVEDASEFIEDPSIRLEYQQWLNTHFSVSRTAEASVMRIEVGPPTNEETKVARTAKVTINVQGYTLPDQILKTDVVQQLWYRSTAGWWLQWTPPPTINTATPAQSPSTPSEEQ